MRRKEGFSEVRARAVAVGIAAGMVSAMGLLSLSQSRAQARMMSVAMQTTTPMVISPKVFQTAETATANPRLARKRMVDLYLRNELSSGADYTAAAKLLADSQSADDLLLAHDLAIAGLALGDSSARPLVARTEDRIFDAVGLGERYGTLGDEMPPLSVGHRRLMTGPAIAPMRAVPVPAPIQAAAE